MKLRTGLHTCSLFIVISCNVGLHYHEHHHEHFCAMGGRSGQIWLRFRRTNLRVRKGAEGSGALEVSRELPPYTDNHDTFLINVSFSLSLSLQTHLFPFGSCHFLRTVSSASHERLLTPPVALTTRLRAFTHGKGAVSRRWRFCPARTTGRNVQTSSGEVGGQGGEQAGRQPSQVHCFKAVLCDD